MDNTYSANMPLKTPTHFTVSSLTTGQLGVPQGEIMKLSLSGLEAAEREGSEPVLGKHVREAIAIVKDWRRNP